MRSDSAGKWQSGQEAVVLVFAWMKSTSHRVWILSHGGEKTYTLCHLSF